MLDDSQLRKKLNKAILDLFAKPNCLNQMAHYHMETGGKRLRGLMALEEALNLGVELEHAMPWACSCEVLHNATLVHDDIQDHDPLRRGRPSLWKKVGPEQAINAGDYLLARAFGLVSTIDLPNVTKTLLAAFSNCMEKLVMGQAFEMLVVNEPIDRLWDSYLEVAEGKTSALLQAPAQGAYILAGRSLEESDKATREWLKVGIAYQINDDLNDYQGHKQANQKLKDFEEKKINAIVAFLARFKEAENAVQAYLKSDPKKPEHQEIVAALCDWAEKLNVSEMLQDYASNLYREFDEAIDSSTKRHVASFFKATNVAVPVGA